MLKKWTKITIRTQYMYLIKNKTKSFLKKGTYVLDKILKSSIINCNARVWNFNDFFCFWFRTPNECEACSICIKIKIVDVTDFDFARFGTNVNAPINILRLPYKKLEHSNAKKVKSTAGIFTLVGLGLMFKYIRANDKTFSIVFVRRTMIEFFFRYRNIRFYLCE